MQTPHIYRYSQTLFVIFYPEDCCQVAKEAEALCFMKNASTSGPSKSQMFPSLLLLPAFIFKVLPLPQKFNRFHRFQLPFPLPHPCKKFIFY